MVQGWGGSEVMLKLDTHFILLSQGECLSLHWVPVLGQGYWGNVNICFLTFFNVPFLVSMLEAGIVIPHLESLDLGKVFLHSDRFSN